MAENLSTEESLQEIAKRIADSTGGFTGGPADAFGEMGLFTLESLKENGLRPDHRVLDVGCGALRLGYWLVRFLNADRYFGLEPVKKYVDAGMKYAIGPELAAAKKPRFDHNQNFDFSPFGETFDFVVARSIFSHASPRLVFLALDSFRDHASESGMMLTSYKATTKKDGDAEMVNIAQTAGDWGWRRYSTDYLVKLATERGLFADGFGKPFNGQGWLRVSKKPLPPL
jgi:SAM-dependent methyltransferase